jgi:hypothetical protein
MRVFACVCVCLFVCVCVRARARATDPIRTSFFFVMGYVCVCVCSESSQRQFIFIFFVCSESSQRHFLFFLMRVQRVPSAPLFWFFFFCVRSGSSQHQYRGRTMTRQSCHRRHHFSTTKKSQHSVLLHITRHTHICTHTQTHTFRLWTSYDTIESVERRLVQLTTTN